MDPSFYLRKFSIPEPLRKYSLPEQLQKLNDNMSTSFLKLKRRKKVCLKWLCIFLKLYDLMLVESFTSLSITFHSLLS